MASLESARSSAVAFVRHKYTSVVHYLFQKCDPTAVALFRILFGFCMFLDVPQERGLEEADFRFGDPNYCFFPLFPFLQPLKLSHACIVYSVMWMGSLGIMLGCRFRLSCFLYLIPFVYFQLLDKSRWNNHSYLFALTVILLWGSGAGEHMSLDNVFCPRKSAGVPRWNYFMLKFQFFILYFYAAVKKIDADWLSGYPMKNLANHWLFDPIKFVVSEDIIELYMIHLGGFFYDLTVGFMLNIQCTKKLAFFLSFMFHGLNSQLFTIGMFPYVCLASLVLFCEPHEFPLRIFNSKASEFLKDGSRRGNQDMIEPVMDTEGTTSGQAGEGTSTTSRFQDGAKRWKVALMATYILIQITLPFTHSITKGYNNWTPGLYGYSWDMMVHSWNTLHIKITVVDLNTRTERFLDPDVWVTNDRWSSHADMAKQYSQCIARNLAQSNVTDRVEVYLDVWKSLNGRFQQRVFDPRVNIVDAPWSPWEPVTWLLPLLTEYSDWRKERIGGITENVANWTASSNVVFVADYPGLFLENYMPLDLANVTITLLSGEIVVEQRIKGRKLNRTLSDKGPGHPSLQIATGDFHRIYTVSIAPSSYMYTYTNATMDKLAAPPGGNATESSPQETESERLYNILYEFIQDKLAVFTRSFYLIFNAYVNVLLDVPMVVRRII